MSENQKSQNSRRQEFVWALCFDPLIGWFITRVLTAELFFCLNSQAFRSHSEPWLVEGALHYKILTVCVQLAALVESYSLVVEFVFVHISDSLASWAEFLSTPKLIKGLALGSEDMWVLFLEFLKHFGAVLRLRQTAWLQLYWLKNLVSQVGINHKDSFLKHVVAKWMHH